MSHGSTTASFEDDNNKRILQFPKADALEPQFGTISQAGTLDGVLIKIGGRDETVPVHLHDGENYFKCTATREMARQLAPFLFAAPLRVSGTGKWNRTDDGEWVLENFKITSWEHLSDDPLSTVFSRMGIASSDWDKIEDPLQELRKIRKGNSKVQ